ncbi:UDP-glucuronosyl/UDP-glucosyltransferase - like 10 [Theobroma cacao]|nr:UDP-glucuronosyl/UDP-glucosyltransferase - like 10 [Theobroma cacao]
MDHVTKEPTTVCHVLAVPFPSRGHINPMMNLCKSLLSKNMDILVTFVVSEEWFGFIGSEPKPDNIRFGTIPNDFTSELDRSGNYSPDFFEEVLRKMEAPVEQLIDRLEPPVTTIVYDAYLTFAVRVGNRRKIPLASFWTMPALVYSVFHHFDLLVQNRHFPINLLEQGEQRVDCIPGISSIRKVDLPTCLYGKGLDVLHRGLEAVSGVAKVQYLLLVSVYELESQIIEALKEQISTPVYHIGPPIPYFKLEDNSAVNPSDKSYFQWLDSQPESSVLYVSQGSLHSATSAQLDEIAAGLRISGVRYFWVARKETPRFEDECGEKGLIVPWCDQLRVLCHPSIGGFWSHCGWNSTSEAIFAGVPMLTFPIYWDQTPNSKQIVEDWKIGWRVKNKSEAHSLVPREEIAGIIRRFMNLESEEGKEMRKRAKKLSQVCRQAVQKGGSSDTDLQAFVNDIAQCHK